MNLLYLANVVVAEVGEDYYWHWTHDQEIGKALVAACATIVAALIAITGVFLTARKTTQQIELSKQGTPPELTRYKEWLEVSARYKEIANTSDACKSEDKSEEYQEIESSRKEALKRATWERKVLSVCPDIRAQKRILNIPQAMSTAKKIDFLALWPWLKSMPVKIVENIFAILMTALIFVTLIEYIGHPLGRQSFFADVLLILIVGYIFSIILPFYAAESGEIDAEYYFIRLRSVEAKVNAAEIIESFSMYIPNKRRVRLAHLKSEYRDWIYYPGFSLQGKPFLCFLVPVILFFCYFFPIYWIFYLVVCFKHRKCTPRDCKHRTWVVYGAYRPEAFESGVENLENKELLAQGKATSDKEDKESAETKAESKN